MNDLNDTDGFIMNDPNSEYKHFTTQKLNGNDEPRIFTTAEVQQIVENIVEDWVRTILEPACDQIQAENQALRQMLGQALGRIDDLRDRLDELKANPSAVKLMKQPVNVQGIPAYERLHKITCQVWHNHPLTPEMKRKHWTEYQVKLEVETADRMLFHTRISTYSPKHFFAHKKKAACAIGDDVRQFLEYQHSTEYWVGMVLVQPHGGGSIWMPEQVIALHFDQERPQVKLLTDGELIEFTNFRDGHGTKDAADWIATWRREARSSELQDAE